MIRSTASTRDRLLQAAAELFYAEGVGAVGVERLCQVAGVSKRSMYQLFATKDDVVAESLRVHGPAAVAGYFAPDDADVTPRERILHVFRRLDEMSGQPGFHGCPFANTTIELHDSTQQASVVAWEFKQKLQAYFTEQATELGLADPAFAGLQLIMLFDGASVRAVMSGAPLDGLAERAAAAVLDRA